MRYKFKNNITLKEGDEREVNRFLFLPKIINEELRWMERTSWIEVLTKYSTLDQFGFKDFYYRWVPKIWGKYHIIYKTNDCKTWIPSKEIKEG